MQASVTAGHLILLYEESEWYDVDDKKREYYKLCAQMRGQQEGCGGVSIMVQPDDLLSRMPTPNKLRVYTHNFPKPAAEEFFKELVDITYKYNSPDKLSIAQIRAIALKVFG